MKPHGLFLFVAFAALALAGCSTDPETGETLLFGVVPVSETTEAAAQAAADKAAESGGVLGIVGVVAGAALAWWRRRKELASASDADKAKLAASSVIDGVEAILSKVEAAKQSGESWAPSREELIECLVAAQQRAGTQEAVNALRGNAAGTATGKTS